MTVDIHFIYYTKLILKIHVLYQSLEEGIFSFSFFYRFVFSPKDILGFHVTSPNSKIQNREAYRNFSFI